MKYLKSKLKKKLMNKKFIIIGIISVVLLVYFLFISNNDFVRSCFVDSDCILVYSEITESGCCDCNHAGRGTSINKRYSDYWEKKLDECEHWCSLTLESDHWTCTSAVPECVNFKCQLKQIEEETQ